MGVGSLWDFDSIYTVVDAEATGSRRQRNKREGLVGRKIRQVSFARQPSERTREGVEGVRGGRNRCLCDTLKQQAGGARRETGALGGVMNMARKLPGNDDDAL